MEDHHKEPYHVNNHVNIDNQLLSSLLDELDILQSLSGSKAMSQVYLEVSPPMRKIVSQIFHSQGWGLIRENVVDPLPICLLCISTTCLHLCNSKSADIKMIWSDRQIAEYVLSTVQFQLKAGLSN